MTIRAQLSGLVCYLKMIEFPPENGEHFLTDELRKRHIRCLKAGRFFDLVQLQTRSGREVRRAVAEKCM